MSVVRVEKNTDYTVVNNFYLKDKNISLKAKGLLSIVLSLPDEWDYSVAGLAAICAENETAVKSALNELKKCGYLIVTKKMPGETKSGRIEYEYKFREQPQKQDSEKQGIEILPLEIQEVEKQEVEIQAIENQGQLNTNISNTKKLNISSKSDDDIDSQLSLTVEYNAEPTDKPQSGNARVISVSVKEAAEAIYKQYPRKEGKTKGFEEMLAYLKKGRNLAGIGTVKFNHEQLYCAVRDYAMDCSDKGTEKQFIQLFSTFMNKTVIDYAEKSAAGYEKYMERKYGSEWRAIKFTYR